MLKLDSYNNWRIKNNVTRYKYALKQLEIQLAAFEDSDFEDFFEVKKHILDVYWGNLNDFAGSDLQPPVLIKLLYLADHTWAFPRTLKLIHHYISLITDTTPIALPALKDYFYHMLDTIIQAICCPRQLDSDVFEPLNKFRLASDAIDHFYYLTQETSELMKLSDQTDSDCKAAFEAAEKLAAIAENIASEVSLNGSRERIVKSSALNVFLNKSTRNLYHILMNHLLVTGDIDSIDKISYIHDQARDIISHSLSNYKTEHNAISITTPDINELLTQLSAVLREVISDAQPRGWEPPEGYIGSKEITKDDAPPRSTLQTWAEKDNPTTEKHPQTNEIYFPESWLKKRLKNYKPKNKG